MKYIQGDKTKTLIKLKLGLRDLNIKPKLLIPSLTNSGGLQRSLGNQPPHPYHHHHYRHHRPRHPQTRPRHPQTRALQVSVILDLDPSLELGPKLILTFEQTLYHMHDSVYGRGLDYFISLGRPSLGCTNWW